MRELLDWRPYERTSDGGDEGDEVERGAVCYVSEEDGIVTLERLLTEASDLGLDPKTGTLYVSGEYLIADFEYDPTV